jgi:hypothetical protein
MTADNPSQGTGLDAAASAFEAILTGSPDNQEPKNADEADVSTDEVEAQADDEVEETAPDEGDETEEEAPTDEEDEDTEDEQQPKTVTVKLDGKAVEVPFDEVVNGYQRQADYSRKTQALAEERKAFEAERAQVQSERHHYAQVLSALQNDLATQAQSQQPDWDRLYAEDPIEWVRQRELWRDRQERVAASQAELQRVQAQQTVEQQQALAQHIQSERSNLIEKVPTWKDDKVWERDRKALRDYGNRVGFSEEELSQAYDHRAIVALYKAMKYDALMSQKVKPDPAPPTIVPKKASAAVSPRPTTDLTRNKQRLAKTGSVRDAAKVFEGLI